MQSAKQETTSSAAADIRTLIARLDDEKGVRREQARQALVAVGHAATPVLLKALKSDRDRIRWEAAKALQEIKDPAAAPALVEALEDEIGGVRWLAAEGLVALGPAVLPLVLRALIQQEDEVWLWHGAHHVLRAFADGPPRRQLMPVLKALESHAPSTIAPAALDALETLERA